MFCKVKKLIKMVITIITNKDIFIKLVIKGQNTLNKVVIAFWSNFNFQNFISIISCKLESLHDIILVWLLIIILLVFWIFFIIRKRPKTSLIPDSSLLEQTWTLTPIVILITIAYPSLYLLCLQDDSLYPFLTIKLISNQWNWQREFIGFQDHLIDREKLDELSSFDYPLIIPVCKTIRVIISSRDVLHSLGIPSLSIKLDSAPGRLNVTTLEIDSPGLLVGSCYELCGRGHSSMPIYMYRI